MARDEHVRPSSNVALPLGTQIGLIKHELGLSSRRRSYMAALDAAAALCGVDVPAGTSIKDAAQDIAAALGLPTTESLLLGPVPPVVESCSDEAELQEPEAPWFCGTCVSVN